MAELGIGDELAKHAWISKLSRRESRFRTYIDRASHVLHSHIPLVHVEPNICRDVVEQVEYADNDGLVSEFKVTTRYREELSPVEET